MLDQEDLKWIATSSTELNSMLQQISRYADLARQHKGEYNHIQILSERVESAAKIAQALFDRVTSSILEGSNPRPPVTKEKPAFSVVRSVPSEKERVQKVPATKSPATNGEKKPATDFSFVSGKRPAELKILNPTGKRELILFVENEEEVTELAAAMLIGEDYRVVLAGDGGEALRIYHQIGKQIGLVILDFFLPVMDGDAVFEELRAMNPNIAVVLSSGFAEQSKVASMLAQGLRGFIPKPYTSQKLLEQVRSILDASRAALV
ncbi:MAG: response regulator [Chthoniobacterales bacterium]